MLLMDRHIRSGRFTSPTAATSDRNNVSSASPPQSSLLERGSTHITATALTQTSARLLMQIHDELIFEVHTSLLPSDVRVDYQDKSSNARSGLNPSIRELNHLSQGPQRKTQSMFVNTLRYCMEVEVAQLLQLTVPLVVNVTAGENWADMTDVNS